MEMLVNLDDGSQGQKDQYRVLSREAHDLECRKVRSLQWLLFSMLHE